MFKRIALVSAVILFGAGAALAATGTPPGTGPSLIDGGWLNGLAGGQNESYQSGIAAAGSGQSSATQLPSGIALLEVDSGSGGVALPTCFAGSELSVYNNTGGGITVYPTVPNNPATSAQDTINNSSSFSASSGHTPYYFACAKNGVWSAK